MTMNELIIKTLPAFIVVAVPAAVLCVYKLFSKTNKINDKISWVEAALSDLALDIMYLRKPENGVATKIDELESKINENNPITLDELKKSVYGRAIIERQFIKMKIWAREKETKATTVTKEGMFNYKTKKQRVKNDNE